MATTRRNLVRGVAVEGSMMFELIAVAICTVPVAGVVGGLVDLFRGDMRKTIADAFELRTANMSRC